MSFEIQVALISGGCSVIVAIFALVGVIVTAKSNRSTMQKELEKQMAVFEEKMHNLNEDVKEHNHYAKLFAETMPVVREQIKVINHRLSDLERKVS